MFRPQKIMNIPTLDFTKSDEHLNLKLHKEQLNVRPQIEPSNVKP
jgi:hypothetical protein